MEFMKYDLIQTRIDDLKAMRHPRHRQETVGFSFWDTLSGWWQSLRAPAPKLKAACREELLRQEWMINTKPANKF